LGNVASHGFHELSEQRSSVVRARSSLGVVLDGKDRQTLVAESFNGPVVQVEVSNLEFRGAGDGSGVGPIA
jgi:hypothetical protein